MPRTRDGDLRALFATLTVAESRMLHARLSHASEGDLLARLFERFVLDRRLRLLADARRREAVSPRQRSCQR